LASDGKLVRKLTTDELRDALTGAISSQATKTKS
jgi:hypothetical protein